jgi:hypothetical protein
MCREAGRKNLHPDEMLLARMEEEGRQETRGRLQQNLLQKKTALVADEDGKSHGCGHGLTVKGCGAEAGLADRVGHGLIEKLVG